MIIAIDGPAGSGKTTVAKRLAEGLGFLYLDTGATYRTLTLKALQEGVSFDDPDKLVDLANNLNIKLEGEKVFLDGQEVTKEIRSPLIDRSISKPVALSGVREAMVKLQRGLVKNKDAVVEGRDITSIVFPQAGYKFFLDANIKQRAKRRYNQLCDRGIKITLKEVERQMNIRDEADLNRDIGPLRITDDAIYLDTTDLSVKGVLDIIVKYIKNG
ncbi:MAG: (d)CMP kinase [Candidatus Omnitrophota bacterium]